MADDGVVDGGLDHLGGRQEAGRCVDGGLLVVELKAGGLDGTNPHDEHTDNIVMLFTGHQGVFAGVLTGCEALVTVSACRCRWDLAWSPHACLLGIGRCQLKSHLS